MPECHTLHGIQSVRYRKIGRCRKPVWYQIQRTLWYRNVPVPDWNAGMPMTLASMPMSSYGIKEIVRPFKVGGVTKLIRSCNMNWRPGKFFFFNFNDTSSREELKSLHRLKDNWDGFVQPRWVTLHDFFWSPASKSKNQPPHSCILPSPTLPEDDLLRMAKSWKMTYRESPNPGRWLTENGQIPAYDKPELARPQNISYHDPGSPASQFAKFQ